MKNILLIALACLLILATMGCVTTTSTFPLVYTNNISTEFEILGTVFFRSTTSVGYYSVFEEARKRYPSTDFVIDIMIDQHEIKTSYNSIVYLLRLIVMSLGGTLNDMKTETIKHEYTIRGTAIRYIQPNQPQQISPAPSSIEENYTVTSVTGQVQIQRFPGDTWSDVRAGDVLSVNFRIRTAANASLVLVDRNNSITIPGGVEGRISNLVGMLVR